MARTGLVGLSLSHSRSPLLHREFARQFSLKLQYELIETDADSFTTVTRAFFKRGGRGLNVTVPHKFLAASLAQHRSPAVQRSGACNVLTALVDGTIKADNVDGVALVRDLSRLGFHEEGMSALILGAGGAAAGIVPTLLDSHVDLVYLYSRSAERARMLVEHLNNPHVALWSPGVRCELIVNATSASLANVVPSFPQRALRDAKWAYDLVYSSAPTPFMRLASEHNVTTADGWGMLVAQAAETFALWHGHMPQWEGLVNAAH